MLHINLIVIKGFVVKKHVRFWDRLCDRLLFNNMTSCYRGNIILSFASWKCLLRIESDLVFKKNNFWHYTSKFMPERAKTRNLCYYWRNWAAMFSQIATKELFLIQYRLGIKIFCGSQWPTSCPQIFTQFPWKRWKRRGYNLLWEPTLQCETSFVKKYKQGEPSRVEPLGEGEDNADLEWN